jgi:hypothetical protein
LVSLIGDYQYTKNYPNKIERIGNKWFYIFEKYINFNVKFYKKFNYSFLYFIKNINYKNQINLIIFLYINI